MTTAFFASDTFFHPGLDDQRHKFSVFQKHVGPMEGFDACPRPTWSDAIANYEAELLYPSSR
jgi:hypothetical protein